MSVLSDRSLRACIAAGKIRIDPTIADMALQPASIDVRLGPVLHVRRRGSIVDLRISQADQYELVHLGQNGVWLLEPGLLYLGATLEWIEVSDDLLCHIHGRSTFARAGIVIHQQAGLIDPGYLGTPTLEISVLYQTWLRPGDPIGQLVFQRLTTPAERPYSGHYQGQTGPHAPHPLRTEVAQLRGSP